MVNKTEDIKRMNTCLKLARVYLRQNKKENMEEMIEEAQVIAEKYRLNISLTVNEIYNKYYSLFRKRQKLILDRKRRTWKKRRN
jgi:hypothetical protein